MANKSFKHVQEGAQSYFDNSKKRKQDIHEQDKINILILFHQSNKNSQLTTNQKEMTVSRSFLLKREIKFPRKLRKIVLILLSRI